MRVLFLTLVGVAAAAWLSVSTIAANAPDRSARGAVEREDDRPSLAAARRPMRPRADDAARLDPAAALRPSRPVAAGATSRVARDAHPARSESADALATDRRAIADEPREVPREATDELRGAWPYFYPVEVLADHVSVGITGVDPGGPRRLALWRVGATSARLAVGHSNARGRFDFGQQVVAQDGSAFVVAPASVSARDLASAPLASRVVPLEPLGPLGSAGSADAGGPGEADLADSLLSSRYRGESR